MLGGKPHRRRLALLSLTALLHCKPATVTDAETKGDVAFLVANGSPEAVAALGRLADKDPKAKAAVEARAETDLNAYIAAWGAVNRGAPWGAEVLRAGLRTPERAETAASAMTRGHAKLSDFGADLSKALVAAGAAGQSVTVAAMIASMPTATEVGPRLADKTTRANMCRGLASPDASAAARKLFLSVGPEQRDDPACVDTTVRLATLDNGTMTWLADGAEPGLLAGAGKAEAMPCARLAETWTRAFSTRPPPTHSSLAVPLSHGVKRCPADLDAAMATALVQAPVAAPLIVSGIDAYGADTKLLKKTCAALGGAGARALAGRMRERAADIVAHGCKGERR